MYLGFDISTAIVGWSLVDQAGLLVKWGYIEFPKKTTKRPALTLFEKMEYFSKDICDKLEDYRDQIDVWGVEQAVKKFQDGLSTAQTIYVCASFNFGVAYEIYQFLHRKEPIYIPVSTARKTVGLKIPRGLDKTARKGEVVKWCKPRHPSIQWGLTRNGTYKAWCFDVADSLVIAEAIRLKHV
jgi:hypothetical protein